MNFYKYKENFTQQNLDNNSFIVKNDNIDQNYINQLSEIEIQQIIDNYSNNTVTSNNIFEKGPLKLGCCLKNNNTNNMKVNDTYVSYMVPLTQEVAKQNQELASFKYQRKNINIPANTCPVGFETNLPNCYVFMEAYCKNMINQFNKLNLPLEKFKNYCPECACFSPKTETEKLYPLGTPSKCYKEGCNENSIAYLDDSSRNTSCNLSVCNNIINTTNISGEKVELTATLENQCGYFINNQDSDTTNQLNLSNIESEEEEGKKIIFNSSEETNNITTEETNNIVSNEIINLNNNTNLYIIFGVLCCILVIIIIVAFIIIKK